TNHHPVGPRLWCRRGDELDCSGFRSESPNHISALHGEPENPVLIEDRGMRITRRWIRHEMFDDLAGFRIELSDRCLEVSRVPDVALFIGGQAVRPRFIR